MVYNKNMANDYLTELNKNGTIAFVPSGNSMWPTIKNRKQSVIVNKKAERLNNYDVAFYIRDDGKYVLHRVIEVIDGGYIMNGDSQYGREKVREDQVIGVMIGFYRGKKYIDVKDPKYIKEVQNWLSNKPFKWFKHKAKLKLFYTRLKIKSKLASIFKKQKKEDDQ